MVEEDRADSDMIIIRQEGTGNEDDRKHRERTESVRQTQWAVRAMACEMEPEAIGQAKSIFGMN